MSYDLNILVVDQKVQSKINKEGDIEIRSEKDDENCGRYQSIWPFICSLQGIWYCLGIEEDGWYNTLSFLDAEFDEVVDKSVIPTWITEQDVICNLVPLIVRECYMKELLSIIKSLLEESPNNTIVFLARFQGGETEIIKGVIPYNKFVSQLFEKKVLFNIAYVITV